MYHVQSVQSVRICYPYHAATAVLDKKSFSYCAPKIWNELPLLARQSPSLHTFKRNLKTHYFADNYHLATASSTSDSAMLTYSALYKLL